MGPQGEYTRDTLIEASSRSTNAGRTRPSQQSERTALHLEADPSQQRNHTLWRFTQCRDWMALQPCTRNLRQGGSGSREGVF